jgi:hypothetical protein
MSVVMIFRIAIKALGRNKMRTALTMLGMIIGVGAVITMVALGTGSPDSIDAQIQSAGTNMIWSTPATSIRAASARARATPARSCPTTQRPSCMCRRAARRRANTRATHRRQPELEHDHPGH